MGKYEKSKKLMNNFFEVFETKTVNLAVRLFKIWKLKSVNMNKNDHMDSQYKKDIIKYWSKYTKKANPIWHKYYSSRNGIYDVRYIPDDLYYTVIDQHFNNRKYGWGVNDKNYYQLWFNNVKQPITIIHKINNIFYNQDYKILSIKEVIDKCSKYHKLIIKPAVETGGSKGIVFWNQEDGLEKLQDIIQNEHENLIVQELIKQHETLSKIHPSSVNTIRTISLLFNGDVHILSSVLRMGIGGSKVDNASAGGITCGIREDGRLKDVAYSAKGVKYEKHPQGYIFNECIVPSYDKVVDMIKKQHIKMGHFRLISWDIAIGEDGEPILIEANLRNGQCDFHQFNNGPLFGNLTDKVLEEVFINSNN